MSTLHARTAAEALAEQLRADGYRPGPPAHLGRACATIDRDVCVGSECDDCGFLGLMYKPWHRGDSYRAVAACPRCGGASEF